MLGLEDSIIFAASLDVGILTLNPIKENTQNIQLFCHGMKQSRLLTQTSSHASFLSFWVSSLPGYLTMSATASTNMSALPTLSGLSAVSETLSVVDYSHLLHVSMDKNTFTAPFLLLLTRIIGHFSIAFSCCWRQMLFFQCSSNIQLIVAVSPTLLFYLANSSY